MKSEKNIYIYSIVVIAVIGAAVFWTSRDNRKGSIINTPTFISPSPGPSQVPMPSQTPGSQKNVAKPTPALIVKEVNDYQSWVELLEPINRRLALDENCMAISPSQVAYPNNTQIMLDNTFSAQPRILKIGGREYSLDARGWLLVTLRSTELPAKLTMFCGSMELGQLDLE